MTTSDLVNHCLLLPIRLSYLIFRCKSVKDERLKSHWITVIISASQPNNPVIPAFQGVSIQTGKPVCFLYNK